MKQTQNAVWYSEKVNCGNYQTADFGIVLNIPPGRTAMETFKKCFDDVQKMKLEAKAEREANQEQFAPLPDAPKSKSNKSYGKYNGKYNS